MNQSIIEACSTLRLPSISQNYQVIADQCAKSNVSHTEFLNKLFECELQHRDQRGKQLMQKLAGFPSIKTLEGFDFNSSNINKAQVLELATLRFVENSENIILLGPSGTGKTHIAISLGFLATQNRQKVKFITASDLVLQLEAAQFQNRLDNYFAKVICHASVLIIDEFGYVKLNERQSNLLFQVVNKRYERGPIIVTSNLIFTKWQEVLNNDEALTAAILDRLIHHSHIINVQGDSYRLKQKRKAGIIPA
jgi:DNA replication protein DnaC